MGGGGRRRGLAAAGAVVVGCGGLLLGLFGHNEHLQAVFQVGKADVGVVVQGQDLGVGIHLLEPLGHAAADHMVGQAAEGLQDDEVAAALFGVVQDLGGDQHALAGVKGVVDDGVAGPDDVLHPRGLVVERVPLGNGVGQGVGRVERLVGGAVPQLFAQGLGDVVFLDLGVHVEVGLADDVGHPGLDDLKAVGLQILLDVVVGAGVEVEQVLAHDQDGGPGSAAVVFHRLHPVDGLFKALFQAGNAAAGHPVHDGVHAGLKGGLGGARLLLVGADLAQQLLHDVDHGQGEGQVQRGRKVHLEAGVHIVAVLVVVGQDGDVRKAGVVQGLAQQGAVVGQAAVADVLGHGHGGVAGVILAAVQGGQGLADDDLRREADVVMDVLLAQADGLVPAQLHGHGPDVLGRKGRRHHPAESVGGVGHQDHPLFDVGLGELDGVGIGQGLDLGADAPGPADGGRLHKGAHPDAEGTLGVALVQFEDEGALARDLVHHAGDLVREVGVVAAAKADDLDVLQAVVLGGQHGGSQHPGVVVVDDVQPAAGEVHLVHVGQGVVGQHRDAQADEQFGQRVVDQLVVLIGAAGQHHRVAVLGVAAVQHGLAGGFQLIGEAGLGGVAGGDGLPGQGRVDAERGGHILGQLAVPVGVVVPVEQRRVKGDAPAALGVVRVADDDGVALDHRAHRLAGGGGAVGLDGGDGGHEDAVHLPFGQVPQMAVDQLGREADGVRRDGGQAFLVQGAGALARQLDLEAQAAPEGVPEGHGLPEGEHPGDADGHAAVGGQGGGVVVGKEQLFPQGKQVGDALDGLVGLADPGLDGFVFGVAQNLAPLAAVAGDKTLPGGETDHRPAAVVLAEGAGFVLGLGISKGVQRLKADEVAGGIAVGFGLPLGQQGRADGAHLAGVGRAGDGPAQVLFQGAQHRVILKGAALHHDPAAQHVGVGDAHHLGEHVLDDGAAQPGHDVVGGAAVLLLGDDAAVHKDGAAAAQLGGVAGTEGRVGDAVHRDAQRGGELLQKGAAARGAGLVQQHIGDDAVLDPDGFHVLAADVQQEGDVGQVVAGGRGVGHRLNGVVIAAERLAQHHFAVAGGAKTKYV